MTILKTAALPSRGDFRSLFEQAALETGFHLTVGDRVSIERILSNRDRIKGRNALLLHGLLRCKLRISRGAPEPAPSELATSGRQITYMKSGGGAQTNVLAFSTCPFPGIISVASLIGATLIGMRKLQRAPLLRDDGEIETIVVLDVKPLPAESIA